MSFFKKSKGNLLSNMDRNQDSNKLLSDLLKENITYIRNSFNNTADLKIREVTFREKNGKLVYLETMVDETIVEQSVLTPLLDADKDAELKSIIKKMKLNISPLLNDTVSSLLVGSCALVLEGEKEAFLINTPQTNNRTPEEPENEKVVRGAHQGFIEDLNINLTMIRQRIKNRQLMIKNYELGMETNTQLSVIYMNNLADPSLIKEIDKRVSSISMDMIFSPGYIEETIEDNTLSPFPQIMFTERPDRVEAQLMEGRVAIMSQGSSDAMIIPVTFFSFFQTPDDYNIRFYAGTIFRVIRLLSFWGALLFPSLYIAIVGYHFEMIPYDLITIMKNSTENIPFPPFFEALIMAITIELIREAGIRLPSPIGQTIGIVGGLIIGDAVVNAGLVSNMMVIVIAVTAIMSFTLPSYEMGNTVRLLSFPTMIAAATLGFVGITFILMLIIIHMCKLQSFGVPYFSPLTPFHLKDLKDAIVRFPSWLMTERPNELHPQKQLRERSSREWEKDDQ